MEAHPAAETFPMMDAKRFAELKADIQEHGQRTPIILCEGMILDGRNRYKACQELGIIPKMEIYQGNPWALVWSENGCRRDLVAEQRYLIWKECDAQSKAFLKVKEDIKDKANQKRSKAAKDRPRNEGGTFQPVEDQSDPALASEHPRTETGFAEKQVREQSVPAPASEHPERNAAAAMSQTNAGAVARGDKLLKARPDLAEKVMRGELKPAEAHRQMRRDEVRHSVALPSGKYRIIYADPPWKYGDPRDGHTTGAEDHYPTMSLAELCALPIAGLSADNAVLFLWTTSPFLEDSFRVLNAWGFKYKTSFVWDKVKHNMGHYNSVRHEFLLVCTRGSCTPDNTKLFDSVQSIERTSHSKKPEEFRAIIDTLYTVGRRLELFARTKPKGWEVWGNEA